MEGKGEGNLENNSYSNIMPKHYAKKHLTKTDPIFDQLNEIDTPDTKQNGDKTTKPSSTSSRNSKRS